MNCAGFCASVPIVLDGQDIQIDFYVLQLQGADVVLGVQWLELLGRITMDYKLLYMEFMWNNKTIRLQGKPLKQLEQVQPHNSEDYPEQKEFSIVFNYSLCQQLFNNNLRWSRTLSMARSLCILHSELKNEGFILDTPEAKESKKRKKQRTNNEPVTSICKGQIDVEGRVRIKELEKISRGQDGLKKKSSNYDILLDKINQVDVELVWEKVWEAK